TRETGFEHTLDGVRTRLGGVHIRLGDHPYSKELAALGLPKRAILSSSAANVQMTFGDAQEIS
ncbi:acetoacetate decarboxylase, partial [Mycobacterium intermedium]